MPDSDDWVLAETLVAPGYLANHAVRVFNRQVDAALRPHGLSIALLGPILLLARRGTLLQRDLVRSLGVGQPAMVPILAKLERAGLIARTPNPDRRRETLIVLTPEGAEAATNGERVLRAANAKGVKGFSRQEAQTLAGLLRRFLDNLEGSGGT